MIGLFDSGLGGLTVLRRLREWLPDADVLYFADQANVPYGDRSAGEIQMFLRENVAWLEKHGCEAIVMACNTSCAIAATYGWPRARARIFDLIDAGARDVAARGYRRVAVVATVATVRAGAYAAAIAHAGSRAEVREIAAPALVPLVEARADAREVERAVSDVCANLDGSIDALVYGCTHYPLIDDAFARVLGARVERIDPAVAQAANVALATRGTRLAAGRGATEYATSGALQPFALRVGEAGSAADPKVFRASRV
ncbi:MAG: glutamate racemase [Candidatus Tyrphobacter sp.]